MSKATLSRPPFVDVLSAALQQGLPGAVVRYEPVRRSRYRFFVIDESFDRMGHPERQQLVWDIAERVLDKADLWNVSMILTMGREDLPPDEDEAESGDGLIGDKTSREMPHER